MYRHQPLLYVGVTFDSSSGRAGVYMYCPIRGCNLRKKVVGRDEMFHGYGREENSAEREKIIEESKSGNE